MQRSNLSGRGLTSANQKLSKDRTPCQLKILKEFFLLDYWRFDRFVAGAEDFDLAKNAIVAGDSGHFPFPDIDDALSDARLGRVLQLVKAWPKQNAEFRTKCFYQIIVFDADLFGSNHHIQGVGNHFLQRHQAFERDRAFGFVAFGLGCQFLDAV